jgi:uncharacterized protein (TIGR02145 family)
MKKTATFFTLTLIMFALNTFGQTGVVSASFTAVNGTQFLAFDSLVIRNLTRGGDTLLKYPDTTIVFGYTGIAEPGAKTEQLHLYQNYPNPMNGSSKVRLFLPRRGEVELRISDTRGKVLASSVFNLAAGLHRFRVSGEGPSLVFLSAISEGETSSIKMINGGTGRKGNFEITYIDQEQTYSGMKQVRVNRGFSFKTGDTLLYTGYYDTLQTGICDRPQGEAAFTFQFAFGIPCPGMPTVDYQGITYHTVQVFNQCWMKENLNAGTMIADTTDPSDNGIIEKYCYGNIEDSCGSLGAFYQWNEMMAYTTTPGAQGICPAGWHIPSDNDWKILEGVSDSLYGVGDTTWDAAGVRGVTVGFILKSPWFWANDGNGSDIYGFTVLPSGYRDSWGYIYGYEHASTFWCSNEDDAEDSWTRGLGCHGREISRFDMPKESGYSVRCLRDITK